MIRSVCVGTIEKAGEHRVGESGRQYAVARMLVDTADGTLLAHCSVFSVSAVERLMELRPGDPVAMAGRVSMRLHRANGADPEIRLSIVVDEVAAARRAKRPRGGAPLDDRERRDRG